MADETQQNVMNLDLNLGPVVHPSQEDESETLNLDDWLNGPVREAIGHRTRARQRWRSVWRPIPIPMESRNLAMELTGRSAAETGGFLELTGRSGAETGEGSVAADERPAITKACDNGCGYLENEPVGEKDDDGKINQEESSFFDCNICLDLATEPVVTCCGHLFCWPCIYRWLHLHSEAKECPICKGEVAIKTLVPIYGRGNPTRVPEEDQTLKIPHRPQAKRIESWRQTIQRNAFTMPMEEMIRRLGSRFDLSRDLVHVHPDNPQEYSERTSSLLNRFFTSRGIRREQNTTDAAAGTTNSSPTNSEAGESHRLSSLLSRRSNRAVIISNLTSALNSAERLDDSFFRSQSVERNQENQEQAPSMEDRDSMSSIAAIIQSESQTIDNAIEIDSRVSLSTSSSRRRGESSRVSDVDSGDSRAPRRRRLH